MSIYCTLWELRFPKDGYDFSLNRSTDGDDIEVFAQQVPSHIRNEGKHWKFLPPAVDEDNPHGRAVVITTEDDEKGTKRNGQEYHNPLLVLTGEAYAEMTFDLLHEQIIQRLRLRHEKEQRKARRKMREGK